VISSKRKLIVTIVLTVERNTDITSENLTPSLCTILNPGMNLTQMHGTMLILGLTKSLLILGTLGIKSQTLGMIQTLGRSLVFQFIPKLLSMALTNVLIILETLRCRWKRIGTICSSKSTISST
jgi:hypothetical protein